MGSTSAPSSTSSTTRTQILLASPPLDNFVYPPAVGGRGNDVPQDAAVDAKDNIWIVGNTDSDDFLLVNPIVAQKVPYRTAAFVLELDPSRTKILFATWLCGQQSAPLGLARDPYSTLGTAIAIDSAGNVYVGGSTDETDFPTTPGAFLTKGGGYVSFSGETYYYSFLVKISPAGKLVYSTLLGTGSFVCSGGSSCIGKNSTSASVSNIAVDTTGSATVAGARNTGPGYVFRIAPDGSRLLWSADVGGNYGSVGSLVMAQDAAGDVNLLGEYAPLIHSPGDFISDLGTPGLFAAKLKSDGSALIYSTDFGQSPDSHATGVVLDASGNPYLAGTSSSAQFPMLAGVPNLGPDFVLRLDTAGTKALTLFRFPAGILNLPPLIDTQGRLLIPGSQASLLTIPPQYHFDTPAIIGFANAASYAANSGIYPGTLVSLFGFDLPLDPRAVQVFFGGRPAPVLYAGPNQINVQAPFAGVGPIQVILPSGSISLDQPYSRTLGIFTADGVHAAALNQDGSANSASNPAPRGSIVSLFGTGAVWPSNLQDGAIATSAAPFDQFQSACQAFEYGGLMPLLYAGAAPGIVNGVFQVNVQVLPTVQLTLLYTVPLTLQCFGLSSNAVRVYISP